MVGEGFRGVWEGFTLTGGGPSLPAVGFSVC